MPISKITSNSISTQGLELSGNLSFDSGTFYIDASNNRVGIGTSNTTQFKLHVNDSGGALARLTGNGEYSGIQLQSTYSNATANGYVYYDATNEGGAAVANYLGGIMSDGSSFWSWSTQPAGTRTDRRVERVRIDATGNVGIGISSPSSTLDVRAGSGGGISGPTTNTWASKIVMNTDSSSHGGLSVQSRWGGNESAIFEAARGWNGSSTGYFPALSVRGSGQIQMPWQPSFRVYRNDGSYTPGATTIVWNSVAHNTGGHYNTTNGRFTAPVSGTYVFMYQQYYRSTYTARGGFFINGVSAGLHHIGRPSTAGEWTGISTLVVYLNANDYVTCAQHAGYTGELFMAIDHSWFTGYLLG